MLNTSNSITLKYSNGTQTKSFEAISVEFSWEPVGGKVEEDVDYNLIENWQDWRALIDAHIYVQPSESTWLMENFLPATDKEFVVDSKTIPVVLAIKRVRFKHLKKKNFKGDIKLKFRHKAPGALP